MSSLGVCGVHLGMSDRRETAWRGKWAFNMSWWVRTFSHICSIHRCSLGFMSDTMPHPVWGKNGPCL